MLGTLFGGGNGGKCCGVAVADILSECQVEKLVYKFVAGFHNILYGVFLLILFANYMWRNLLQNYEISH